MAAAAEEGDDAVREVLVEAAGLRVVDEVVLHDDARAALVRIEPPAAVTVRVDVVDAVVVDGCPG